MLSCENISLAYGKTPVLENINLELSTGQSLAVVGKSGCGKSSLLYVLSGLRRPSTGRVVFDGVDVWHKGCDRLAMRRLHFGFVFQQHFLINYLTVEENIMVPALDKATCGARLRQLMVELGLSGLENRFPYELSGGQRQRTAIGRALINEPKVIFADEPTAMLDSHNANAALELIKRHQQQSGAVLVLVTHDMGLVEGFDQVLSLA